MSDNRDNFTGPGTYRVYWRYQRQADHCDQWFGTQEEAEDYICRIEKMGYVVRKVCRLIDGEGGKAR